MEPIFPLTVNEPGRADALIAAGLDGVTRSAAQKWLEEGTDVILEIELQGALQGCQGIKTAMGNNSFCGNGAGSDDATLKLLHISNLPS